MTSMKLQRLQPPPPATVVPPGPYRGQAVQDAAEKGDLSCLQQVLQCLGAGTPEVQTRHKPLDVWGLGGSELS